MKKKFVVLGIAVVGIGTLCGYSFANKVRLVSEEVTAELGEQLNQDVSSYVKGNTDNCSLNLSNVDINQVGVYEAYVVDGSNKLEFQVNVKDTTPPEADVATALQFGMNEQITAKNLVTNVKDLEQVTITFADGVETKIYNEAGTYTETVVLTDTAGNMTSKEITIEILADNIKPVFKGLKNRSVYVGSTIDYLKNVTASDNLDGDLTSKIVVDSSKVNLDKAGKYKVIYSVSDSSGNTTTKKKTVTVKKDAKPVIKGVKNRTVYVGDTINYLKGVTATDKRDGNLTSKIVVDSLKVDLKTAGTYKVTYSVTDSSDNTTKKTAKIVVKEKSSSSTTKKSRNSSSTNSSTSESSSSSRSGGSSSSSSGGFTFHSVEPEGGDEVVDTTKPGGKQNVGTW